MLNLSIKHVTSNHDRHAVYLNIQLLKWTNHADRQKIAWTYQRDFWIETYIGLKLYLNNTWIPKIKNKLLQYSRRLYLCTSHRQFDLDLPSRLSLLNSSKMLIILYNLCRDVSNRLGLHTIRVDEVLTLVYICIEYYHFITEG